MTVSPNATRPTPPRPVHHAVLENGLTVVAMENPAADIIASRILINGGSRLEHSDKAGVSHLMAAVLTKGTDQLSSQDIAEKVESIGASLGTDATADYCLVGFKTVAADFSRVLTLASEIVRSPSFPDPEVDLERRLTLQGIRSMQEQPFTVAYQQLREALYHTHAYATSGLGTEDTVASMTQQDLFDYYRHAFRPDNMVVSLAGRINPQEATDQIAQVLGDWRPDEMAGDRPDQAPMLEFTSNPQTRVTEQNTMQSVVMLGFPAASVYSPDYMALKLLSTHLGNGLSSRLFVELREKRGLAYDVSAIYPTRVDYSHFVVYMGTAPTNVPTAIEGLQAELERVYTQPLTADELQIAKNKLLGQYALGKQTNAQIAQLYGWYEVLGLGINFDQTFQEAIAALTADDILRVANQYVSSQPYMSLVGPGMP